MRKFLVAIFSLAIVLSSCQNQEKIVSSSEIELKEAVVLFNGVKVRKPAGISSKIFELATNKDVSEYLDNVHNSPNARLLSQSTLNNLTDGIISKYFNINEPIYAQKDPSKILKDFPDFSTKEDLMKNAELILNYYNRLIINDLKKESAKVLAGSKVTSDNGQNPVEQNLFNQEPIMGNCMFNASLDARDWTHARFSGINADDWRGNAFKHAVWNAQGVRKIVITGYSQWTAYEWTKRFATAHEYTDNNQTTPWVLGTSHQNIMDYHNNMCGRSFTKNNISTNIWGNVIGWPSESTIVNAHYEHVNDPSYLKITPAYLTDQQKGQWILNLVSHTGSNVEGLSNSNYTNYIYLSALRWDP